jgi:hypothetical protein
MNVGLLYLSILFTLISWMAKSQDYKGTFFVSEFLNKKGEKVEGKFDLFFKTKGKTYIVKDCKGVLEDKKKLHLQKAIIQADLLTGPIDYCDPTIQMEGRWGEHLNLVDMVMEKNFKYQIEDGSGNQYIIYGSKVTYNPISKSLSSSGFYDGGKGGEYNLENNERILLMRKFKRVIKSSNLTPCSDRKMLTVRVQYDQLGEDQIWCSAQTKQWEKFFKHINKSMQ